MKIAFMFSGQGSQKPMMGKELYDNFDIAKEIFDKANNALDFDLLDVCFTENELLDNTEYTQPALLTTSHAAMKVLESKGVNADYMLGLSLGEYTALVGAESLDFEAGVKLVNKRGQFMNKAVENLDETGMYAVLSLDNDKIKELVESVQDLGTVEISNYNTVGQTVVAGELAPLEAFVEKAKEAGARKCIRLNVSGPFHTSLLNEASINLAKELENVEFNDMKVPVVTNLTGEFIEEKSDIKEILTNQVKKTVMWQQSIELLLANGVDTFIELGPNKVLSGFVKKINRKVKIYNIEDIATLDKFLADFES